MSPDVNNQSEVLHQAQIEDHVRSIHNNYKEASKQNQEFANIKVSQIKFKSDETISKKAKNNENIQTANMTESIPKSDDVKTENSSVIFQFNNSIDNQTISRELEQRHDVFDPNGNADWGAGEMGGFLTGQTNVTGPNATQKELQEQVECGQGVKMLKNSWSD